MRKALLIVDPQIDFISGSLPVPDANNAMDNLAQYLSTEWEQYYCIFITLDWHPIKHSSFSKVGGIWPVHCVAFSEGAAVYPKLMSILQTMETPIVFLTKGENKDKEEYSIFQSINNGPKLCEDIKQQCIAQIDICGIAGDVCVLNTLNDGLEKLPEIKWHVLEEFSPSLDGGAKLKDAISHIK